MTVMTLFTMMIMMTVMKMIKIMKMMKMKLSRYESYLVMQVIIVKEVMTCEVLPVAMFCDFSKVFPSFRNPEGKKTEQCSLQLVLVLGKETIVFD